MFVNRHAITNTAELKKLMVKAFLRGHPIVFVNGDWVYKDTGRPTAMFLDRPCGHCGKVSTNDGHDGCLGILHGVMNACCGHGQTKEAYVQFLDGVSIHGESATIILNELKKHK